VQKIKANNKNVVGINDIVKRMTRKTIDKTPSRKAQKKQAKKLAAAKRPTQKNNNNTTNTNNEAEGTENVEMGE
jgi:hypothetical protein